MLSWLNCHCTYFKIQHFHSNITVCTVVWSIPTQVMFGCPLCRPLPGDATVSVSAVGVTVLASVPQTLASIYKLCFLKNKIKIKLCSPGHWAAQSLGETLIVFFSLSTTEDRSSWTVDNVPGRMISPKNGPLAPIFLLQITLFVTAAVCRVIVCLWWWVSFIFSSLWWAVWVFTFDLVYIPSTSH